MIEIQNLTMKYKNGKGVSDISISVDNGEVKGLLGPNGAGKSFVPGMLFLPEQTAKLAENPAAPIRRCL